MARRAGRPGQCQAEGLQHPFFTPFLSVVLGASPACEGRGHPVCASSAAVPQVTEERLSGCRPGSRRWGCSKPPVFRINNLLKRKGQRLLFQQLFLSAPCRMSARARGLC